MKLCFFHFSIDISVGGNQIEPHQGRSRWTQNFATDIFALYEEEPLTTSSSFFTSPVTPPDEDVSFSWSFVVLDLSPAVRVGISKVMESDNLCLTTTGEFGCDARNY